MLFNIVVILGPTASGKTALAARLASVIGGEIISADSRQVYRRMDLGTGKDYGDYLVDGKIIPVHLIDIRDPGYKYNVYEYQTDFFEVFKEVNNRGSFPVMCGGTGLYIESVIHGFKLIHVPPNPPLRETLKGKTIAELETILRGFRKLHNFTDTGTVQRATRAIEIETYYASHPGIEVDLPRLKPLVIGIDIKRDQRREKITSRLEQRLNSGLVEEVRNILAGGVSASDLVYYGLEYKYVTMYIEGFISYKKMKEQLNIAIHQFAKRQMTWFRRMERNGFHIHWLDADEPVEYRVNMVVELLKNHRDGS